MNLRLGHGSAVAQEVEVAALVGLQHVLRVQQTVAARILHLRAASRSDGAVRARRR